MNPDSNPDAKLKDLRTRRKEATRREILAAAEGAFIEHGVFGARMELIAERAGVSVGTLYNYFDDRDNLLATLLAEQRAELLEKLDLALPVGSVSAFETALEQFLCVLIEHFRVHWQLMTLLIDESSILSQAQKIVAGTGSLMPELLQRATSLVQGGVREGTLREADLEYYPALLLGTIRGLIVGQLVTRRPPPTLASVATLQRFFMQGAGSAREGA